MRTNRPAARSKNAARRRAAAVSVGAGILGTLSAEAGIVIIDISPSGFNFDGVNAGLTLGPTSFTSRANFPTSGSGGLFFENSVPGRGVRGTGGLSFASDLPVYPTPHNFPGGAEIGSSFVSSGGVWSGASFRTFFRYSNNNTPNFGSDNYLGFQTINGNYGWLKSTWDGTNFQFTSAAYESTPGVAIAAGAVVVPEPSTTALLGLGALALGAGAVRKQRAARRTQAAAAMSA